MAQFRIGRRFSFIMTDGSFPMGCYKASYWQPAWRSGCHNDNRFACITVIYACSIRKTYSIRQNIQTSMVRQSHKAILPTVDLLDLDTVHYFWYCKGNGKSLSKLSTQEMTVDYAICFGHVFGQSLTHYRSKMILISDRYQYVIHRVGPGQITARPRLEGIQGNIGYSNSMHAQ